MVKFIINFTNKNLNIMNKALFALTVILFSFTNAHAQSNHRGCGTMSNKAIEEKKFPELIKRRADLNNQIKKRNEWRSERRGNGTVTIIPIVVHILYNNSTTNISTAQVEDQIDVLNADFRKTNYNVGSILNDFQSIAEDCEVQFCLATIDPSGNATTGITRTSTSKASFNSDLGEMKSASTGGVDIWNRDKYLNIWVTPALDDGVLGFAQFPGGQASTDGVVIAQEYFGSIGTATTPPFNKGRTATHEVGHWLGLYHIWGDSNCGDDQVSDTPAQQESSSGCPLTSKTCDNKLDNVQNYMDYSADDCMAMFTRGQAERVWNVLNTSRSGLKTSVNSKCSTTNPPTASFDADIKNICAGSIVSFTDKSTGSPDTWAWTFSNGTPSSSTDENPTVIFNDGGVFDVSLISTNTNGSSNLTTKSGFITVTKIDTAILESSVLCNGDVTVSGTTNSLGGQIEWYSDVGLQNQLEIGVSHTSTITQKTKFYAVVNSGGSPDFVGNLTKGIGGFHAGNQGIIFNVDEQFTLLNFQVYAETAGSINIDYTNPSSVTITKTFSVQVGVNTLIMNVDMVVGNDHQLFIPSGSVSLHRDNSGVTYPYALGDLGSVHNSTATGGVNLDYYYYFYNWKVKKNGCLSEIAEITASPDNCVGVNEIAGRIAVFPNPSDGYLTIENISGMNGAVSIFDLRGALILTKELSSKNLTVSSLSQGTYVIRVKTDTDLYQQKFIVK